MFRLRTRHQWQTILVLFCGAIVTLASAEVWNIHGESEMPAASSINTKITVDSAPLAVQHVIRQEASNASVDVYKRFENGRFVYVVTFVKGGLLNELLIASDGSLLSRRERLIEVPRTGPAVE